MATTIAISCPKCENQIKAPAELAGKKIRCKECQHVFVVKAPPEEQTSGRKPAAAAPKPKHGKPIAKTDAEYAAEDEDGRKPYSVTTESLGPRCPYCAKELDDEEQVICLNCGYNRRTRERINTAKTLEPTGGEWFIHLLPGILCALVVLMMLGGLIVFWTLFPRIAADNSEEWWSFFFGLPGRIWNSIISLFIGFFAGKYAIKRLILHPRPPEKAMKTKKK